MKGLLLFLLGGICGALAVFFLVTQPRPLPATDVAAVPAPSTSAVAIPVCPPVPEAAMPNGRVTTQPSATTPVPVETGTVANPPDSELSSPQALLIPVDGIKPSQLTDTFDDARTSGLRHDAIDIMAPKGTRVFAVADGKVAKLFNSVRGGLTVYEFDPTGTIEYYYAHLDGYAPGLAEGTVLRRGDPVGFVGSTGDANPAAPHLHFEIALLGPEKNWWKATDINPYPILTGKQTLQQAVTATGLAKTSSSPAAPPPPSQR